MEKLCNRRKTLFIWALCLSFGLPLGIFMMVFGFIREGSGYLGMAITGILLLVGGFYVMPMLWIRWGYFNYLKHIGDKIIGENIHSVSILADNFNKENEAMANEIKYMIQHNYLPDYVLLDNERIVNKNSMKKKEYEILEAKRAGSLKMIQCPYCNAKVAIIFGVGECPYCSSKIAIDQTKNNTENIASDNNS